MNNATVAMCYTDSADEKIPLPCYATPESAGMDLHANFPPNLRESGLVLKPATRGLIPTGLRLAMPDTMEASVRPRSGLALHHGITVLNSPGTIDADYRGELGVILINHGGEDFHITHGMRIAQIVFNPIVRVDITRVDTLPDSLRGDGGFGSTGRG